MELFYKITIDDHRLEIAEVPPREGDLTIAFVKTIARLRHRLVKKKERRVSF